MRQRAYFLKELSQSNKPLLLVVLGFLSFAAFSAWTKFEGTPVYMWTMFAVPATEHNDYTVTVLYADGQEVGSPLGWQYFSNMVRIHSEAGYLRLKNGTYAAPEFNTIKKAGTRAGLDMDAFTARLQPGAADVDAYPAWLKRYTEHVLGRHIRTLQLRSYIVAYTDAARLKLVSSQILFTE